MLKAYMRLLRTRPVFTKSSTSAIIAGAGDLIMQEIEQRRQLQQHFNLNAMRTARMAIFGFTVAGPLCHYWFNVLEYLVPHSGMRGALSKMIIDQTIMAPVSTMLFFGVMGILEQQPLEAISQRIKDKTWSTLIVNWKVWPAAQMVNLYFVPISLRVLFLNIVGLGYNAFLSSTLHPRFSKDTVSI